MKHESITLQKIEIKEPPDYKIIFLNDNVTPMDFVSYVLEVFFNYTVEESHSKMMEIHNNGSAIIGVYSFSVAETRKELTDRLSKKYNYPLVVKIEQNN